MPYFKTILTLVVSGLLSACGGGSDTNTDIANINTPANPSTTINAVGVVGTSSPVNTIAPINAGVNGGEFSISWDVDSSDPYHVDMYLSDDNTLGSDVKILSQNCGSVSFLYNCDTTAVFDCRFTSSNKMSCGTISAANTEKDLTVFLNTIPKQAYLIFEACNALLSNCKTASVMIELQ